MRQPRSGAPVVVGFVLFGGLMLLSIWLHQGTGELAKVGLSVLVLPFAFLSGIAYRRIVLHNLIPTGPFPVLSYAWLALPATVATWFLAGDLASRWPFGENAAGGGSFYAWFFIVALSFMVLMAVVAGFLQGQGYLDASGARPRRPDSSPSNLPVIEAAKAGDLDSLTELLSAGADVDQMNHQGSTPLMSAAHAGHTEAVRLLLSRGAKVDAKNQNGETALVPAVNGKYAAIVRLLVEKGANVNVRFNPGAVTGQTILMLASAAGSAEIVTFLIEKGADVSACDDRGSTPLMYAAVMGQAQIVKVLLKNGADANARDRAGSTALTHASMRGHIECVAILQQGGRA